MGAQVIRQKSLEELAFVILDEARGAPVQEQSVHTCRAES